jgi:hypothetical protein
VNERNNKCATHIIQKPMTYEVNVEDYPAGVSIHHDNVRKMNEPNAKKYPFHERAKHKKCHKPGGRISTALRPFFLQECKD